MYDIQNEMDSELKLTAVTFDLTILMTCWPQTFHGCNTPVFLLSLQDNVDLGDLMFSLCYLPTAGRLTITVIKARNLKAMDITGASGSTTHSGF